jgi:cytochrome c oxidase subunit 4
MAHDSGHDPHAPVTDVHHVEAVAAGEVHVHPTWKQYKWVALILTLITVVEVWVYYIPAFVASRLFVPALLIMSAVKFVIVVMFYMHLKYDHKLFRVLFTGPLIVAVMTILALLFLFSKLVVSAGG